MTGNTDRELRSALPALPRTASRTLPFRVGPWLVLPDRNRLERDGCELTVEPRIMHVLVCLAARPGEVVSRADLLDTVWYDVTVGEEVLTRAVSQLRLAFGDESRRPMYIETIRGGGYRLVATVAPVPRPERHARVAGAGHRRLAAWVIGTAAALAAAASAWLWLMPSDHPPRPTLLRGEPFTSYPGEELYPSWSPNGSMVAFVHDDGGGPGVFVKQLGAEGALRLISEPGFPRDPVWSPDGSTVAFILTRDGKSAIATAPVLGGPARVLYQLESRAWGLDWSPNGGDMVVSTALGEEPGTRLYLLDVTSRELRALTRPDPRDHSGDSQPAWAPDGMHLAFVRCDHMGLQDVWITAAEGGGASRLTRGLREIQGLSWCPDGSCLVVSAAPAGSLALWLVSVDDGSREQLPVPSADDTLHPDVGDVGLVFVSRRHDFNVWPLPVDGSGGSADRPLISSTRVDRRPVLSPDGSSIAFVSDRTGSLEVWVCAADGTRPDRLTELDGAKPLTPRWSPDGATIAISVTTAAATDVRLVDVATHATTTVEVPGPHESVLGWSPDGNWVVFESDHDGRWELHRVRRDGSDATELPTPAGAIHAAQVLGPWVLLQVAEDPTIWRVAITGGADPEVAHPAGTTRDWSRWWATQRGFWVHKRNDSERRLWLCGPGATEARATAITLPAGTVELSFSAAGERALATRLDRVESDLVLVLGGPTPPP